jgi:hypothetical protein
VATTIQADTTRTQIGLSGRGLSAVATVQGVFYLATGVWPLVHIDSFQSVTGPKTDLWLVDTVGLLVAVIGGVLLIAAARRRVTAEVGLLAVGAALALAGIDVVFVNRGAILPVYLADAAVEAMLVTWWGLAWLTRRRVPKP